MDVLKNDGMNQTNQNPLNVNLKDSEELVCEKCGGNVFEEKLMIRKISKFLTGQPQDSIMPIPVIACADCNHVNEMFRPKV